MFSRRAKSVVATLVSAVLIVAAAPAASAYERYGYLNCNTQQVGRLTSHSDYQTSHWRASASTPTIWSLTASWYNGSTKATRISYTPPSVKRVWLTGDGTLDWWSAVCTRSL